MPYPKTGFRIILQWPPGPATITGLKSGCYCMEATFSITERDYVRAMMLFYRPRFLAAAAYAFIAIAFGLFAIFGPPRWDQLAIIGLVGGVASGLLTHFVVYPFFAKRHYRKYKGIHERFIIQLKDEGVWFESPDASGLTRWENIYRWRQNNNYLLIYLMPRLYQIIPKAVADSGFDLSLLIETLQSRVGKET